MTRKSHSRFCHLGVSYWNRFATCTVPLIKRNTRKTPKKPPTTSPPFRPALESRGAVVAPL
jgi:hypothetical protein